MRTVKRQKAAKAKPKATTNRPKGPKSQAKPKSGKTLKKTRKTRSDKGIKRPKKSAPSLDFFSTGKDGGPVQVGSLSSSGSWGQLGPATQGPLNYWVTEGCVLVTLRDGSTLTLPRSKVAEVVNLAEVGNETAIRALAIPDPVVSLFIQGDMPTQLWDVVQKIASDDGDPGPFLNLWARLRKNPSSESRRDLYGFLTQQKIPITDTGTFLAYKGVTDEFKDAHTRSIDNLPGTTVSMPRSEVDSDRNSPCSRGLHVGSAGYAATFSHKLLLVEVCPSDVVSVPLDSSGQKMRVCRYFVVAELDKKDPPRDSTKVIDRSWSSPL